MAMALSLKILLYLLEHLVVSTIVMTNYKSTSAGCNDEDQCEKCKRLIEAAFGPDKPPEDSLPGPIIPDSEIVAFEKVIADKDSERNYNLMETHIINATTPEEGDEKLVQKLEKIEEPPLVGAEQRQADELKNNSRAAWFSDKDMCKASSELRRDVNILDELAKRCIDAPKDKIDSKLLEEMEKIGILQPYSQERSNVPAMDEEIVQMGCPRKSRKPKKKKEKEIELEIRILERNTIRAPRRNFLNRRAMRHLATNLESHNISDIKRSAETEPTVILETNAAPQEIQQKCERQQESPVNNVTEGEKQNKNLNVEKVQDPFMYTEQNNLREIVKYLYEERIQQNSSKVTSRTSEDAPALILSKVFADVDDFRIIPKGEFLTGQTAINSEKKDSPDVSSNTTIRYKHAGQSEMDIGLEEIRRVFDEEKVPLHPFIDLTNSGIEKTSQKTKSQGLESGLDLLQPEYSLNGDIMTEKIECQTLPCTNVEIETSATNISTDTTLIAETTNMERNEYLSKPLISSAIVQLSEPATESASLKEDIKSNLETVDPSPQSKTDAGLNSFIDNTTEATDPQPAEMMDHIELKPKDTELSLSELLKRVRQKSRYESYEQVMFTSQVPEVEPCAGKPPCTPLANPPPKTLPPRPCPSKPKKNKKDKKNPCAKFQKSTTLHTLGLIVTRVPKIDIPQNYRFPEKRLHTERPKASTVMLVPDRMEYIGKDVKNTNISNRILSQKVLNFIREYEPWDSPFLLVTREQKKK